MANQPPGLNGINILGYMGVNPSTPTNYKTYNRAPTTNDSMNFKLGDHWEWNSEQRIWILVALIGGQATWKEIVFGAANKFPTNNGIAIPADGILNVLGDATSVVTSGAANTILITAGPSVAIQYTTDDQIAKPSAGNLNVLGGSNINTESPINLGDELIVNLNRSIQQPATTADGTAGVYSLGVGTITETRFMYSRPSSSTFVGAAAGNLGVSDAINNTGIGAAALNGITTGAGNTAVGSGTLLATTTGENCTSIGAVSQASNVDSNNNTSVGSNSLTSLTGGVGSNTAVGYQALGSVTTGANNTAVGFALNTLVTGTHNIAIGDGAGNDYAGAESSNILMAHAGVVGEGNVIRIGTDGVGFGEQDACYVAGIYNRAVGVVNANVIIDSDGKLGTGAGGGGAFADPFLGYQTGNAVNVLGGGVTYVLGTSAGFITAYDVGGNFNGGGGGNAARFTAPTTGYYSFNACIFIMMTTNVHNAASLTWVMSTPLQQSGWAGNPANYSYPGIGGTPPYQFLMESSMNTFLNMGDTVRIFITFDLAAGVAQDVSITGGSAAVYSTTFSGNRVG